MEIINLCVAGSGALMAGAALWYGCTAGWPYVARWVVYVAVGVVACQFVCVPVLPVLGLRPLSTADQYWACGFFAVGFHLMMDRVFPHLWKVRGA